MPQQDGRGEHSHPGGEGGAEDRMANDSERIYAAMLARGYDGEIRGVPVPPLAPRAWLILILGLVLFLLLWLLGQSFGR